MSILKVLFLPFFALLDIITTHIAFRVSYNTYGDVWYAVGEANELMDGVIQTWWGIALKLAVTLCLGVLIIMALNRYRKCKGARLTLYSIMFLSAGTLLAASIWNVVQMLIMVGKIT